MSAVWLLLAALATAALLIATTPTVATPPGASPDNWAVDDARDLHVWGHLALAENVSPAHGFANFRWRAATPSGARYAAYHRHPPLAPMLIKLVTLPFPDDAGARIRAARGLMLAFFAGAVVLAWLALRRLIDDAWVALAAVLLAFSSFYALHYADVVATDGVVDLFAVMLALHGAAVFAAEGRLGQLLAKVCVALLLGWHVFALVGPLALLGLGAALWRRDWRGARRHFSIGAVALLFGAAVLVANIARERHLLGGATPLAELPSLVSALTRTGLAPRARRAIVWPRFLSRQAGRLALGVVPYAVARSVSAESGSVWRAPRNTPGFAVAGAAVLVTTLGLALLRGNRRSAAAHSPRGRRVAVATAAEGRSVLAALALAAPCWTLVMRDNLQHPLHEFEGMFHSWVALAFFALALPALISPHSPAAPALRRALALCAAALFAGSAAIASAAVRDPGAAEVTRRLLADADAIIPLANDRKVLVGDHVSEFAARYVLRGAVQARAVLFAPRVRTDLAIDERLAVGGQPVASLTPGNRLLFLYDRGEHDAALAGLAALATRRRPDAEAAGYGIHHLRNVGLADDLLYSRRECPGAGATAARFFLHVYPVDAADLPQHRSRQMVNFDVLDFPGRLFWRQGRSCYARRRLPEYPIAEIRTGQFTRLAGPSAGSARYRHLWEVVLRPGPGPGNAAP